MKVVLASCLFLLLGQETSTQIYHVKGDRDVYVGTIGEKQVEIFTKNCLHKANDERAGYYDLGEKGYQSIVFENSDSCTVTHFGEKKP